MKVSELSWEEFELCARGAGMDLPIEQTSCWASYQATVAGRTPWGCVGIEWDGRTVAIASLFDYQTHGYHYLRSHHGPVWLKGMPDEAEEREALEALAAFVRERDRRQLFMRLHVSDRLCYFECCELGNTGCTEYDLMAIGSDFAPQLKGLNEFKTKFCKEVTHVAPDRDVALQRIPYRLLCHVKAARRGLAALRAR